MTCDAPATRLHPLALALVGALVGAALLLPRAADAALADLSAVTWERLTAIESDFDGVQALAIGADGTIFIHDNENRLRRSGDEGRTWVTLAEGVKCCGSIAIRRAGQIFVASPSGLLYSNDNGATFANWDEENTYRSVVVAPSTNHILGATPNMLRRFDLQGNLVDETPFDTITDMEVCGNGRRTALVLRDGRLFINDQAALPPDGWSSPAVTVPLNTSTAVSLDSDCNIYQGYRNGYRIYDFPNGPMTPSGRFAPKDLFYPLEFPEGAGAVYEGIGDVNDILAWNDGPALVAASRGAFCVPAANNGNEADECTEGTDRSEVFQEVAIHPVSGHVYAAISSTAISRRFCFRVVNGRAQPYACGYIYDFSGGLFRSNEPVLQNRVVGDDFGAEFQRQNFDDVGFDEERGGLVVRSDPDEQSFLWIVNTDRSTVSKWAPGTPPQEVAEYRVGLPQGECPGACCWNNGCNMASRVALDSLGNAYVANRAFGMQGTVTKIARNLEDCVDRNGNGQIDTSRNGSPRNYGQDECVLWNANAGPHNAALRALTVDLGNEQEPDGFVWAGGYNTSQFYKLNPRTGQQIRTVGVNVRPYGAVVLATGELWIGTLGESGTASIDTNNDRAGPKIGYPLGWRGNCGNSYGVAADTGGRVWFAGWGCRDVLGYDPQNRVWTRVDIDHWGRTAGRGITIDQNGLMWMAMEGGGSSYVVWWEANLFNPNGQIPWNHVGQKRIPLGNSGPAAIGADNQGIIWMTFYGQRPSNLARINPTNNAQVTMYNRVNGQVYSYTDFTGEVRRLAIGRGSYEEVFDAGCAAPVWSSLTWNADLPGGTSIRWDAISAPNVDDFGDLTFRGLGTAPPNAGPIHISNRMVAGGMASRRYLKIKATLQLNEDAESPLLRTFQVRWSCP